MIAGKTRSESQPFSPASSRDGTVALRGYKLQPGVVLAHGPFFRCVRAREYSYVSNSNYDCYERRISCD